MHVLKFIFPIFLATPTTAWCDAEAPQVLTEAFLARLRAEARSRHPAVRAAAAKANASDAVRRAIRLWDDPTAMMALMAADEEMRRDDGDVMLGAEQPFPRRRLYEARREKAAAEHAARIAAVHGASVNIESEAAQSVIELALMDESIAINEEQVGWTGKMAAAAEQRAADPASTSAEPLRMAAELAQEKQMLDAMRRERESMGRRVNLQLGRPIERRWPRLALPDRPAAEPSLHEMLARLTRENPHLAAMGHMADAAAAELDVARRERDPVVSVNLEASAYSGGDFRQATAAFKVTLPWLNDPAYRANEERARHERDAAEFERDASVRAMRSEIVMHFTNAQNAGAQAATLAREVIPRREQAAEAIENAWISSRAVLMEVLTARSALLAARLEHRRRIAAQRATLEKLRAHVPGARRLPATVQP